MILYSSALQSAMISCQDYFVQMLEVKVFDKLFEAFKVVLCQAKGYITQRGVINWFRASILFKAMAATEQEMISNRLDAQQRQQKLAFAWGKVLEEVDTLTAQDNKEVFKGVFRVTRRV